MCKTTGVHGALDKLVAHVQHADKDCAPRQSGPVFAKVELMGRLRREKRNWPALHYYARDQACFAYPHCWEVIKISPDMHSLQAHMRLGAGIRAAALASAHPAIVCRLRVQVARRSAARNQRRSRAFKVRDGALALGRPYISVLEGVFRWLGADLNF